MVANDAFFHQKEVKIGVQHIGLGQNEVIFWLP